MPIYIAELLENIPEDTMERVDRARKQIHRTLRFAIRKETGLDLKRYEVESNVGKSLETTSVPVRLVQGVPEVLRKFSFDDDYWLVLILSRYRTHIQHLKESTEKITTLIDELLKIPNGKNILANRDGNIKPVNQLAKDFLEILDKKDPVEEILAINRTEMGSGLAISHFKKRRRVASIKKLDQLFSHSVIKS